MSLDFIAYSGRPWPIDQESEALRRVGRFETLTEACLAFGSVEFVQLPPLEGQLRWRGWSPSGMIVQIERPLIGEPGLLVAC